MSDTPDRDPLRPLAPVPLGDATVYVDEARPVAAIVATDGTVVFATWQDAPLPPQVAGVETFASPNAVWVVYSHSWSSGPAAEPRSSTGVRILRDGSSASFALGPFLPIGADDDGIWLTPKPWPSSERPTADDASGGGGSGGGGGVDWPDGKEPEDLPLEERDALRVPPPTHLTEVDLKRLPHFRTADGGWVVAYDSGPDPLPESAGEPADGEPTDPLQPTPPERVTLRRRGPGGTELLVESDHRVSEIAVVGRRLRATFDVSGPIRTPGEDGSMSYAYPKATVDLDVTDGVPLVWHLDDGSHPLPLERWDDESVLARMASTPPPAVVPLIDLTDTPDSDWVLPDADRAETDAATEDIRQTLLSRGEPSLTHVTRDKSWHRVRSDYRDLAVDVTGEWPRTVVTATFRYVPQGERRFRFRVPVFDASGRPNDIGYMTVWLEEDLDTGDFDATVSDDGFIEIEPKFDG